ncbi:hypothetical protein HYPSUDRAFT_288126 [Hypholoma sublateritium FD-334 SS-4]|uniref:Uncharacterized protein n=1 Tax=Hypholoma sublateritium (strain FD-334 SS-4) TaxID=945553 RepID=A0A0D2M098_HYPSF|nr:hypothetical protein HYPSUDRAFT_288126 [Hypholoma sublateritium FD-334 SS-4]
MGARIRALVECGGTWTELGQSALRSLDELRLEQPEQRVLSIQDLRSPLSYIENNALSVPEGESARPSSDFSSIGPSQSVSQVNGHELPPPVSMAAVMNSVMFGGTTAPGPTGEQTDANGGRRTHSHHSSVTGSSIFSNAAVPATYQVETVTYAPAIAVHVAGKEAAHETTDNFPTIPLPAPHALDGYVYDIPTAAGPSGSQQPHSRSNSNSGHSTPQATAFKPTIHTRHVLERRITEDSQEDKRRNSGAPSDDVSSFEEVRQESQLLEEGKLALVENPRFLSEARRREIEKEKEKARREEEERMRREKGKLREGDDKLIREKKRFGLFHHAKPDQEHAQEARGAGPASATGSPGDQGSPSKSFLGSIRGLFSTKARTASASQQSPSRGSRAARADDDSDQLLDSDEETSPSKTPSRGLSLFRADKRKAAAQSQSQPGGWETRTDRNIDALARRGGSNSFDGELTSRPAPSRFGGGIAGAAVAQAGVVSATGIGRRTRAASEDGTGTQGVGGGGKRLKKARGGASAAAGSAVESNVSTASSATQRTPSAAARSGDRRSASFDVGENRKSWGEQTDEGEGNGMIVDLGRRRRVASEVGATKAAPDSAQRASKKAASEAQSVSKSAFAERTADVFGPTPGAKGYESDTPAVLPDVGGGVTKKKSLSKKRGQEPAPAPMAPPMPSAALQTASAPASTVGHGRAAAAATPTRKPSTKVRSPLGQSTPSVSASPTTSGTTVLAAGGAQPSGVLVPQAGWNAHAHAHGGGLSRNNSVASAASAPAGGTAAARPKRKTTTLGQGVGGSGGVARRASLTHAPSPTKAGRKIRRRGRA